jgi:DNA repair protein RadC
MFENVVKKLPRDKIFSGMLSELSDSELIAVILGSGSGKKSVFQLSGELSLFLKSCDRMPGLQALEAISGLGRAKSCQILACLELSGRFLLGRSSKAISSPLDLIPQLAFLKNLPQETMACVCLNGANRVVGIHTLTVGLANQTQIHPREAFTWAIQDKAIAVIFAHNHPSGSLNPSQDDIQATGRLIEAGKILEIPVLDHLILSFEGWRSIKGSHPGLF